MKEGFSAMARRWVTAWQQLGFNQRVSLVLASGAVLAGLVAMVVLSSRTSWTPLHYGRIDEAAAAKVVTALEEGKISYRLHGGGTIQVPSGKYHAARLLLADKGLPSSGPKGWGLFR
jgi:flagellar M-ring protein FliF